MKVLILILSSLTASVCFAGGPTTSPPLICGEKVETVTRQDSVLDRSGNQIPYRIVLQSSRCTRDSQVYTSRYLFIRYDLPTILKENDGLLQAITTIWSGKDYSLFRFPTSRSHQSTITAKGYIEMQIAGSILPDGDLTKVPPSQAADNSTVIQVFGDAFATHTIVGPFDQ